MTRSLYSLAALANAAVPGLNPAAVAPFATRVGSGVDAALIEDTESRSWIVRAPATPAAAAALEAGAAVVAVLGRRLGVGLPTVRGFAALAEGGRAAVHATLPGRGLELGAIDPDSPLVPAVGRLIAAIHNIDAAVLEEAGTPIYANDEYRQRRLADLDRAASTGRVPADLLTRWEHALEDVSLWQFAAVPIHGHLEGRHLLVSVSDDATEAHIRGVVGWHHAKVADPADDFAAIVRDCDPETATEIARAYARARTTRPDRHLLTRAQLVAELRHVGTLVDALAAGYPDLVEDASARLRQLADDVHGTELAPRQPEPSPTPTPAAGAGLGAAGAGLGAAGTSGEPASDAIETATDLGPAADSPGGAADGSGPGAAADSDLGSDDDAVVTALPTAPIPSSLAGLDAVGEQLPSSDELDQLRSRD